MTEEQRRALAAAEVWLFDLDNTLYPADCRLFDQIHVKMNAYIMGLLSIDEDAAARLRRHYFVTYGTTLSGLMKEHRIDPHDFLGFVHDIDVSAVTPNPVLDAALARLPGRKLIFTNADSGHAENILGRLGVSRHFEAIFDIADADYLPKPDPLPYARIVKDYGFVPGGAVMLDDMAANLAPAAAMGMTTVWVRTYWDGSSSRTDDHPHVHHATYDLTAWLKGVAGAG